MKSILQWGNWDSERWWLGKWVAELQCESVCLTPEYTFCLQQPQDEGHPGRVLYSMNHNEMKKNESHWLQT